MSSSRCLSSFVSSRHWPPRALQRLPLRAAAAAAALHCGTCQHMQTVACRRKKEEEEVKLRRLLLNPTVVCADVCARTATHPQAEEGGGRGG